jgi:hypothetical protein
MKTLWSGLVGLACVAASADGYAQTAGAVAASPAGGDASVVPGGAAAPAAAPTPTQGAAAVDAPARRYARGSVSVLGGGVVEAYPYVHSPDASLAGPPSSYTDWNASTGVGATVRVVLPHGIVLQPRFDFGLWIHRRSYSPPDPFAPRSDGDVSMFFTPGLHVGYALALGTHVAITPMVGYRVQLNVPTGHYPADVPVHEVTVELPIAIFVGRNGFIEPVLTGGVALNSEGVVTRVSGVLGVGYRLGVVF